MFSRLGEQDLKMKLCAVVIVCLCVLLFLSVTEARKKRDGKGKNGKKTGKGGAKWSCENKQWHLTTAQDLEKKLKIGCRKGQLLSSVSLVGQNGTCKGLTPDLFVQLNSCHWQRDCTFTYDMSATNYMLKLFEGNASDCVLKQPDTFRFAYECSHRTAPLFNLEGGEERVKAGIVRSHSDHPWLYQRHQLPSTLRLTRPKPTKRHFVFTIRSLSLVTGDNLTISTGEKEEETTEFTFTHALISDKPETNVIKNVKNDVVTVSLVTPNYTNGSEGFVLCFRWMTWKKKYETRGYNACRKQLLPKKCKPRKG